MLAAPPPGSPRIRLREIAERCRVSVGTVSKALRPDLGDCDLNPETRAHIRQIAMDLGWRSDLQRRPKHRPTDLEIALVYSNPAPPFNGVYGNLGFTLSAVLSDYGARMRLLSVPDAATWKRHLGQEPVAGVVLLDSIDPELATILWEMHIPAVVLNRELPIPIPQVLCDEAAGMRLVADRLVALGHRRIAWLQAMHWWRQPLAAQRRGSLARELARHGIALVEAPFIDNHLSMAALAAIRPTAVVTYNSIDALVALRAMTHLGWRVPADCSIIAGNDATELPLLPVALSAVVIPITEMLHEAVDQLMSIIAGSAPPSDTRISIGPELAERESLAAAADPDQPGQPSA